MLMDKMWMMFEITGNLDAYLCYKAFSDSIKKKECEVVDITKEEKRA
ncbi:MAG: hypothetical protein WDA24_12035 [Tissierellales bacterium]